MNKIIVDNNEIFIDEDNEIILETKCDEITINITNSSNVYILDINNVVKKYVFNCCKNTNIEFNKFNNNDISYDIDFNIMENSNVKSVISTLSKKENLININMNHIGSNSYSKCINTGVTIDEAILKYNVSGIIEKGSLNCTVLQESKIITRNLKSSMIKPILIINETPKEAAHSATIGYYNEDELFYLETRGITRKCGLDLLNRGLIVKNFKYKDQLNNLF